jgi:hypothetical protein
MSLRQSRKKRKLNELQEDRFDYFSVLCQPFILKEFCKHFNFREWLNFTLVSKKLNQTWIPVRDRFLLPTQEIFQRLLHQRRLKLILSIYKQGFSTKIDPSVAEHFVIRLASKIGESELVSFLMKDSRIDPSALNNESIENACCSGHSKIVELLLQGFSIFFEFLFYFIFIFLFYL